MPSTLVHYTFALKHLHEDFGYRDAILLGAQGPDPWEMYGQLPWCHRKDAKTVRRMGRDTQLSPCEGNYRGFIEYALRSDDRDLLFAYIDGLLMHYCLDRACHPYVFWNTGFTDRPEDSPSVRQYYNFGHLFFERTLDVIISKREGTYGRPNIALRCPKADVKAISSMW